MKTLRLAFWIMSLLMAVFHPSMVFGGDVGICYGRNGNFVPSPKSLIDFLTGEMNYTIPLIRVYDANLEMLEALSGTNLVVTIGVPNEAVAYLAVSKEAAEKWVQDHILKYVQKGVRFRYIFVGNEAIPSPAAPFVQRAISNLYHSIGTKAGLKEIFVTTAVGINVLGASYPPSQGQFKSEVAQTMNDLTNFLYSIGSPLMINVYPYYALVSEPNHISLDYALFNSTSPIVRDGNLNYYNLFDAMVDAFAAATARAVGRDDVKIVVAETGWPTSGGTKGDEPYARKEFAQIYNSKLREHAIRRGWTPSRKDLNLEVYIYEMFDENLKTQQSFGTFYPNFQEKYRLWR